MEGSRRHAVGGHRDAARIDGRSKVTGQARYCSDVDVLNPAYAFLCTSAIARGRITEIDDAEARSVPGLLDILTYRSVGDSISPGDFFGAGGYLGSTMAPLRSDEISHAGQIVAVVLAESFEAARDAASRLKISYRADAPTASFDSHGVETLAAASEGHEDPAVGDAQTAFDMADVRIDACYETPTQHHNPIELFTTTCAWDDENLTVWEPSQNVYGFKNGLAQQLGLSPDRVRVISSYVGGAFGSRGSLTQRTALVALAARRLGRPVKLVATRQQGFTIATYRAETRHRIRIGAGRDGHLQSLSHEGWEVTSRADAYMVAGTEISTRLYACPNVWSKVSLVRTDRNTPGFMRSPPEVPYLFPLESAMDELAVALDMDPVELRRLNDTDREPIKGLPYSSRSLMQCFDAAAEAFGWARRNPRPGSMRDGDWDIGWGCATAAYPTNIAPATVRVTLSPAGTLMVESASHDLGTGTYTAIALTAAEMLGVPVESVEVKLGDSALPPAPVAGGSNSTASLCNVVAKACREIRERLVVAAVRSPDGPLSGADPEKLEVADRMLKGPKGRYERLEVAISRAANGPIEVLAENLPEGIGSSGFKQLCRGISSFTGGMGRDDRVQCAFGAEFVELRVHRRTREIRCSRAVGAFAAGRIISQRTAESQLIGGMIWGISSALHEATEIDPRTARYTNMELSDYLVPVNADIGEVQVITLDEEDNLVNPLGIKGLGELGNVGTNAAVANAVYHATGIRIRQLPIRIEKLL